MKVCRKCQIEKELSEFHKRSSSKDEHENQCKDCRKKYQEENKERIKEYRDRRYNQIKDTEEFKQYRKNHYSEKNGHYKIKNIKYREKNKEELSLKKKEYYEKNKEVILEKMKEDYQIKKQDEEFMNKKRENSRKNTKKWREKNKELLSQKIKDKKKNDPVYKLIDSIRTLIWNSIKKRGFSKNSKTESILGCTFDKFMMHIEEQFSEGMSWENHGEWHLDHKTPISWADTESMVYELNHYTNFQPLWAYDNISKGNKWSD